MANDKRLQRLREMDPIIGTVGARALVSSPEEVNQAYSGFAKTHMSLGDASIYVDRLLKWARVNKGTFVGAISGQPGYGKTSTAIHLWHECGKAGVVAVPPFTWDGLQDIIDGTAGWVKYYLSGIGPSHAKGVEAIYGRYREKSIAEFADSEEMPLEKVKELVRKGKVVLRSQPRDVISFLGEISRLLGRDELRLCGPVVFLDELQVTMTKYQEASRSRNEFFQDIFELVNPLMNMEGSYGIFLGLLVNTERVINEGRPDILQRLQKCNLFIRPLSMYGRKFPADLWRKFADVFDFEDIASRILPDDTLDSMGQIAFRQDLGAGPRTVVEGMKCAIAHYDALSSPFSPIDLMDAYLSRQIAFDSGGKLTAAVREVLESQDAAEIPDGDKVLKLMAAFPLGCPDTEFERYGVRGAKEKVRQRLFRDYLYSYAEGISLRNLAPTEIGPEPVFLELTRDFIQTYSESGSDRASAVKAFRDVVVSRKLIRPRRADQIEGWVVADQEAGKYVGTFDRMFPERRLNVRASETRAELLNGVEEFGLGFWFDPECEYGDCGSVELGNEEGTIAVFRLNLSRRPPKPMNVPYVVQFGYPADRVNAMFMLALVDHINAHWDEIPEDEKHLQIPPFVDALTEGSIELLFGEELLNNSRVEGLTKVGLNLPKEVFSVMCRKRYPSYETLITVGRWDAGIATYLAVLGTAKVSESVGFLRGNREMALARKDMVELFGETKAQAVKGLAESLSSLLELDLGTKDDSVARVRFRQHPAEVTFVDTLRKSSLQVTRRHERLRALEQEKGFCLLRDLGYREEELGAILKLLKARRLVDYDPDESLFIEILESVEERREALSSALADLVRDADVLKKVPDFDDERFNAECAQFETSLRSCDEIEELEEYQTRVAAQREVLTRFCGVRAEGIRAEFDKIHQLAGGAVNAGIPSEVDRAAAGEVAWVSELVNCQSLLKGKFQRAIGDLRALDLKVTNAWRDWEKRPKGEPIALVRLYDSCIGATAGGRDAKAALEAAQGYVGGYSAWLAVLNKASRAYKEAVGCQTHHNESRFVAELDGVFAEVAERFKQEKLEALAHHELFEEQIESIQQQIDNWLRDLRDRFVKAKAAYEGLLNELGVAQYNLHATFDHFDPRASWDNLRGEVIEKTSQHIQGIEARLNRYRTEMLYAQRVVGAEVRGTSSRVEEALAQLTAVMAMPMEELAQTPERYADLAEMVKRLCEGVDGINESLQGVLAPSPVTPEEDALLSMLGDPRGTDLSTLIARSLAESPEKFSLDGFMGAIAVLFRKNRIVISISRRR